jgi:hypothetical protein
MPLQPVEQTAKGQAGQDATGGNGRGKIGRAGAPGAGSGRIDHRQPKPDGKEGEPLLVQLVKGIERGHDGNDVCSRNHCRYSPSIWPGTMGLTLAVMVLRVHMPLVAQSIQR